MSGFRFHSEMTPEEAAKFLRNAAEAFAEGSKKWDSFEQLVLGFINDAMAAARKFGQNEAKDSK